MHVCRTPSSSSPTPPGCENLIFNCEPCDRHKRYRIDSSGGSWAAICNHCSSSHLALTSATRSAARVSTRVAALAGHQCRIASHHSRYNRHAMASTNSDVVSEPKALRVIVASTNPVKVGATKGAFTRTFDGKEFIFEGVKVASGVRDQPMTDEETLRGARNRVINAGTLSQPADFIVAIEGGVEWSFLANEGEAELMCFAWAVVVRSDINLEGKARTGAFLLPPPIADLVSEGLELGEADDRIFGRTNSKQSTGAVGLLSRDIITRQSYYEHAITLALIPFLNEELYKSPSVPQLSPGSTPKMTSPLV